MKRLTFLLLTLHAHSAMAVPDDFARGRTLETRDDAFVHRVTLPTDVYEWVTRDDLGDLRVFDAAGEEVPYVVRRPQTQDEYSPWQDVPVFPIPRAEATDPAKARIKVEVDDGGAIVAVNGMTAGAESRASYLLDTSALEAAVTQMRLDWDAPTDFVGKVRVEASDDLNTWRPAVASATVASLAEEERGVRVDQLELPRLSAKYLRLTQLEGSDRLAVTRVQVRERSRELPEPQWKRLTGTALKEGYEYASGGRFPIDRLKVEAAGAGNFLLTATLYSRAEPESTWRRRGAYTFYRTSVDGVEAGSDPMVVHGPDQYWRVEVEDTDVVPELVIGWLPDEVIYLEQGDVPHLLAYGQAGVTARPWPLRQLLEKLNADEAELAHAPFAQLSEPRLLGGPERLQPEPPPIDWRTIVLWAVLVVGVVVVGTFAYRLLKTG